MSVTEIAGIGKQEGRVGMAKFSSSPSKKLYESEQKSAAQSRLDKEEIGWASLSTGRVLFAISSIVPLQVIAEDKEAGLDFSEHGSQAYSMQDVLHGFAGKLQ